VKTYVLDASALYVFLQNKPAANKVNHLLKEAVRERAEILMSAVNYGEVYGAILREHGPDRNRRDYDRRPALADPLGGCDAPELP